jgi:hypothetical protein
VSNEDRLRAGDEGFCFHRTSSIAGLPASDPTVAIENAGSGDFGQKGETHAAWLDGRTSRKSEVLGGPVPAARAR